MWIWNPKKPNNNLFYVFLNFIRIIISIKKTSREVDAYIARAPKKVQGKLRQLRAAIREVAPDAVESISYMMPAYDNGRIAWFANMKNHIGLYIRPPIIADHKKELAGYKTTKSAVRIPLDKKIPISLIKKLVKARVKRNKAKT